ncbi:MAG TPA: BTAD domain-containing putative transcriptional regulator [Candidatus Dormibacteraeota bacterium]|nr:BTAD domain-containing putative transcriptional regulator [Candidatus Dormibacteraeota bacterium]
MLDTLLIPTDPRGIVLLCGFVVAAAFGAMALLNPPGDPIGWVYIVVAVIGYFFIQTRGLTTFLWLLVAAGGAAVALAGNPSGWVELALGLGLALVAITPLAPAYRMPPQHQRSASAVVAAQLSANGHTSAFLEDPPTRTSGKLEESEAPIATQAAGAVPSLRRLSIRSIGSLRLTAGNQDLTGDLEDHPVLAFLFMYLLARAVLGDRPARSALGDELTPGVTETSQKERLRKQLYALQKGVAPEVAALIHSNRTHVWLELDGVESDVAALSALCGRVRQHGFLINTQLAAEIGKTLSDAASREFLAGFEELENDVNEGRGTASQVVTQAREAIANQLADLVRALAEYQDAIGRPEAAIQHLQAMLEVLPTRQDLARLLVVAYLKTGQNARASEVRRQFALKQE